MRAGGLGEGREYMPPASSPCPLEPPCSFFHTETPSVSPLRSHLHIVPWKGSWETRTRVLETKTQEGSGEKCPPAPMDSEAVHMWIHPVSIVVDVLLLSSKREGESMGA